MHHFSTRLNEACICRPSVAFDMPRAPPRLMRDARARQLNGPTLPVRPPAPPSPCTQRPPRSRVPPSSDSSPPALLGQTCAINHSARPPVPSLSLGCAADPLGTSPAWLRPAGAGPVPSPRLPAVHTRHCRAPERFGWPAVARGHASRHAGPVGTSRDGPAASGTRSGFRAATRWGRAAPADAPRGEPGGRRRTRTERRRPAAYNAHGVAGRRARCRCSARARATRDSAAAGSAAARAHSGPSRPAGPP